MSRGTRKPTCPNETDHTSCPDDYQGFHAWAEYMARTHDQRRCAGCNRFEIWYPRPAGALAPCFTCGGHKIDPATLGADDELICPECVSEREMHRIRQVQAQRAYRWADAT